MTARDIFFLAMDTAGVKCRQDKWDDKDVPDVYGLVSTLTLPGSGMDDEVSEERTYFYLELFSVGDNARERKAIKAAMTINDMALVEERDRPSGADEKYHVSFTFLYVGDV